MSTGGGIFYTVLLIVVLMILLGILVYYAVDTRGVLIQTKQSEQECRQDYVQAAAALDTAQNEIGRQSDEIQKYTAKIAELEQSLDAERQGRQTAEAQVVQLQKRIDELGQQLAELRVLHEITITKIGILSVQVDQSARDLEKAQAESQALRQQLAALQQADAILSSLIDWLDWGAFSKVAVGLSVSGLTAASIGLLFRKHRDLKLSFPKSGSSQFSPASETDVLVRMTRDQASSYGRLVGRGKACFSDTHDREAKAGATSRQRAT